MIILDIAEKPGIFPHFYYNQGNTLDEIIANLQEAISLHSVFVFTHSELDSGTIRAIFRQASRYIPEDELRKLFFTD